MASFSGLFTDGMLGLRDPFWGQFGMGDVFLEGG
jgi:hypothetical protein